LIISEREEYEGRRRRRRRRGRILRLEVTKEQKANLNVTISYPNPYPAGCPLLGGTRDIDLIRTRRRRSNSEEEEYREENSEKKSRRILTRIPIPQVALCSAAREPATVLRRAVLAPGITERRTKTRKEDKS